MSASIFPPSIFNLTFWTFKPKLTPLIVPLVIVTFPAPVLTAVSSEIISPPSIFILPIKVFCVLIPKIFPWTLPLIIVIFPLSALIPALVPLTVPLVMIVSMSPLTRIPSFPASIFPPSIFNFTFWTFKP